MWTLEQCRPHGGKDLRLEPEVLQQGIRAQQLKIGSDGCAESEPAGSWYCAGSATTAESYTIRWTRHTCWVSQSWRVCWTRHLPTRHMLGRHLPGRHLPGRYLPGHHLLVWEAKGSLWWFSSQFVVVRPGTSGPHVWTRMTTQTSRCPHSHVCHEVGIRTWPTISRWPQVMTSGQHAWL